MGGTAGPRRDHETIQTVKRQAEKSFYQKVPVGYKITKQKYPAGKIKSGNRNLTYN